MFRSAATTYPNSTIRSCCRASACGHLLLIRCVALAVAFLVTAQSNPGAVTAADPLPESITIATWNLEWFYDDYQGDNSSDLAKKLSAPNSDEWQWRLENVADVVGQLAPTILALQEVENQLVVHRLRQEVEKQHGIRYRIAFIQGYDFGTEQDVAILYQSGLVEFSRREQSLEMFDSGEYRNVSKHLFARFEWGAGEEKQVLHLCNLHLRATADRADYRARQCRLIRHWMQERIEAGENVIILGDLNTEQMIEDEVSDQRESDIGILRGLDTPAEADDLVDLHQYLPADQRSTHMIGKQFDRILLSAAAHDDGQGRDLVYSRMVNRRDLVVRGTADEDHRDVYYQIDQKERDLSDHYPLMCELLIK